MTIHWKAADSTLLWRCLVFNFPEFVILEDLLNLDSSLTGIKGSRENGINFKWYKSSYLLELLPVFWQLCIFLKTWVEYNFLTHASKVSIISPIQIKSSNERDKMILLKYTE